MSGGLYNPNFSSPVRAASPQIRPNSDIIDRYSVCISVLFCCVSFLAWFIHCLWHHSQYLSELLAEYQKLGPFIKILPNSSRLLNQEILRVSGMLSNQGFADFDRLRHRSPSPMSSSNLTAGTGLPGWNNLQHEVNSTSSFLHVPQILFLLLYSILRQC